MADMKKIATDDFFHAPLSEIREKIRYLDHATRFFLAVKFLRRKSIDFTSNVVIQTKFSQVMICKLLEVQRGSVGRYITDLDNAETLVPLEKAMKNTHFMSPVEYNPRRFESFFKKYATNYEELKVGGVFKTRI